MLVTATLIIAAFWVHAWILKCAVNTSAKCTVNGGMEGGNKLHLELSIPPARVATIANTLYLKSWLADMLVLMK